MEDGRCLLDVINDLESVLSELDPHQNWTSDSNQNGDPSALDEFFQSTSNEQVAAEVGEDALWSPGATMEGQEVYQDPLAEAMASITGSESPLLELPDPAVSLPVSIPTQVLQYNTGLDSPRILTPQPSQSTSNPSSRTESPLYQQIVTPTSVAQQSQQIQVNQNQLNFILPQQGTQQAVTFVSQSQTDASSTQSIQTAAGVLPVINRGIGNVQLRPQNVLPGTLIQTSNGQRILIQQPVLAGQHINLAQLQQPLPGQPLQIQSATPTLQAAPAQGHLQLQNTSTLAQPIQVQNTSVAQSVQLQNQSVPQPIQIHNTGVAQPIQIQNTSVAQPIQLQNSGIQLQSGNSTVPQQTYQLPLQQAIQQLPGNSAVAGKPQSNMSIISVNTPQGPQQILIRANGPQNQNILLGTLPQNVIQIQSSGSNQPAQVVVAQPGLQSAVPQPAIINSHGQPHVLGNVNLVNSAQNVNINMVLPAGQNLQSLQAAQQALQLQGQQIVNIINSHGQAVQLPKNLLNQNVKINIGGQQVPINLQQLKQLQGLAVTSQASMAPTISTPSTTQTVFAGSQPVAGSQHHPIVIGSSTPPSQVPVSVPDNEAAGQLVITPSSYPCSTPAPLPSHSGAAPTLATNHTVAVTQSHPTPVISNTLASHLKLPSTNLTANTVKQINPVSQVNLQLSSASQPVTSLPLMSQVSQTVSTASVLPQVVSTVPHVVQSVSHVVSTVPQVISTVPQVSTVSQVVTTIPHVVSATPTVMTAQPVAQHTQQTQQYVAPQQQVVVQNSPVIKLTPQNQEMMKQLQLQISKLQRLPNRTEKHESLLQQLKEVLQKLLVRARADAILAQQQSQQIVQVKPQQPLTVIRPPGQQGAVKVICPVIQQQQTTAPSPGKPRPPVSATVTLATATTNIPLLAPGQQIKLQIPQALQEKLAKLTPEQQQVFLKTHGPLLVKLHQEQQQRLQQQQQGKIPITVQPVQVGTQLKLQPTAVPTITIQKQPLTRQAIIAQQLHRDQREATHPDFKNPFKDKRDACKRLIRYHVYQSSEPTAQEWEDDDAMYEEVAQGLLDRKQQMFNKFRSLLYAEAMRPQPMSEMVMLEKMFIQAERELLENDRKVAKETPELFKPCPHAETKNSVTTPVIKQEKVDPTESHVSKGQKHKIPVVISDSEEEESPRASKHSKYMATRQSSLKMVIKTSPKHPAVKQERELTAGFDLKPFSIKLEPLPDYKAMGSSNLLGSQVKLERGDLEQVLSTKTHEVMFTDDEDEDDKGEQSQNSIFTFSDSGGVEEDSRDGEEQEADSAVAGLLSQPYVTYKRSRQDPLGLETSQDSELDSTVNSLMDSFSYDKESDMEDSQLGSLGESSRRHSMMDMFGTDDDNEGQDNLKVEVESAINSILSLQGSGLEDNQPDTNLYQSSQESDSQDDLEAAVQSILY